MNPPTIEPKRAVVLVVDDQLANVKAVGGLLAESGFDVMPALSGAQAFECLHTRLPDLVLLDMMMPTMDGFEVAARLRADPHYASIPIIFLTAANERKLLVKAFDAGAVDYLVKPFVISELLARVRTHVELKRTRDHLHLIANECANLTQIVAHDLKSPLSNLQFSLELLKRANQADPARAAALIEAMQESTEEAIKFIQRYLGRSADGELKRNFELTELSLATLSTRSCQHLSAQADASGIEFQLSVSPDTPKVIGDAVATLHVLQNLLSNALKYAPVGSTIDLVIGRGNPGMARVAVMDRGPGIPAQAQAQLFRRYARLDPQAHHANASGLGLAISKQEITQMGGQLWYSERDGGGAAFCFELPIAAVAR